MRASSHGAVGLPFFGCRSEMLVSLRHASFAALFLQGLIGDIARHSTAAAAAHGSQMDMLAATRSRPDPAARREAWEQAQVGAAADDADWSAALAMPKKLDKWPRDAVRSLGTRSIACKFVSPNPKRARGLRQKTVEDYDRYSGATTVMDFFRRGGTAADLLNDVARGFCTLDESALPAAWLEYAQSRGMPPAARYRAARGRRRRRCRRRRRARPAGRPRRKELCGAGRRSATTGP